MSNRKLHAVIITFFIFVSIFLTLGRVGTSFGSFALLSPDLGVYASLAAVQDNPDLFIRDPFLSNEKNTNSYHMVFVPLLKALNHLFGNYGTAGAFLIPFFLFLHLIGYYLLGLAIFRNPWTGLFVSLLISAPISTAYDFWGLFLDVLPRFAYQSLIPFVLVLSVRHGRDPKWWPVILGGVGLLNYVHPLSTPPWAIAIALGLWVSVPGIPFWKRCQHMLVAGIVLLLVLSPFVVDYFKSTIVETGSVMDYEQVISILQAHVSTMVSGNPLSLITTFFAGRAGIKFDILWFVVWLMGIGRVVFGLIWQRSAEDPVYVRQVAAWMLGVFFVSGLIPFVERIIFDYLRKIPPEIELLRTIRYLTPLVLLAAIYALQLITDQLQRRGIFPVKTARHAFMGACISLILLWGVSGQTQPSDFRRAVKQNLSCWWHGQVVCDLAPWQMDFINALDIIRERTPAGARILSEGQEISIRYYALRPLVFTYKDGAPLAYTNQEQLLVWNAMYDELDELAFIRKFPFRHRAFVKGMAEIAQSAEADYILLQEPYDEDTYYPEQVSIVFANDHYSLFKVNRK